MRKFIRFNFLLFFCFFIINCFGQTGNTWIQKTDFGGTARIQAVGFSIGAKGYIGTGIDGAGFPNDFMEYSLSSNTWNGVANFNGIQRRWQ